MSTPPFRSFREFYPYYLQEHSNRTCRRLHFVGTSLVIVITAVAVATGHLALLWALPFAGYGCAWVGHYVYEKNRPATFKHPFYSLIGDFAMYRDIWLGRLSI